MTTLVEQHGGTVNGVEAVAGEVRRAQVETIGISLDAFVPRDRLAALLAVLEDAPPFMLVSGFTIARRNPEVVALRLDGQMQRLMEETL